MSTQLAQTKPRERLAYLDNLRVALTVLVVAHHVALAYGNLGFWPNWQEPADPIQALPLDLFMLLNQAYFMGMFFLLAGYLVPGSVDRRGPARFAVDRLRRLGIPLLAFLLLLRPLYTLPRYVGMPGADRPPYWEYFLAETDIGPIWFLGVLLALSLVYGVVRRFGSDPKLLPQASVRAWHVVVFAIGLGLISYAWRIVVPIGAVVLGIPSAAYLPQYVAFFIVGILGLRRGWFRTLPRRSGGLGAALIAASFVPMAFGGYAALAIDAPAPPPESPAHLAFALWDQLFAVGMVLVLMTLFQRRVTAAGTFARFLAANAYAVYLVHAPLIVGFVALLAPFQPAPLVGFAVVLPSSVVASWMVAAGLRRLPGVRAVL